MSTVCNILQLGEKEFEKANLYFGHGTDNAWDDSVAIVLYVLNQPYEGSAELLDKKLTESEEQQILEIFKKRIVERIPVPYLVHEAYFAGYSFYVDERVLIPRSPFAELIEKDVKRILDIGTGSGCMAIAAALHLPHVKVDASDISLDALEVAKINVEKHGVKDRIRLIQSDVFSALDNEVYDIIISNPPYVGREEMESLPKEYTHEPELALAAGEVGLDIVRKILRDAAKHLSKDGLLFIEVGNTMEIMESYFPKLPFLWLEFDCGGDGVFMLTRDQLGNNV